MKNIRVTYRNEVTVNLGNFENVKPGYELSAELEGDEKPSEVRAKLRGTVDRWLEQEVAEIRAEAQ